MLEPATASVLSDDLARRFAASLAQCEGVEAVIVCGREGEALAGSGGPDVRKEAALASFVAQRAEALTEDGDLRGMGKALANSRLEEIVLSGPGGESLLLAFDQCYAFVSLQRGAAPTPVAAALRVVARRYFQPGEGPR